MRERVGPLVDVGFGILALAVFGALGLAVLGVGAVAVTAELANTWGWYFLMEQVVAGATPIVSGLAVAALLVGVAAVARA